MIGALKSNRKILPLGITIQLKEFTKYIDPSILDVVTIKYKKYIIYKYEGKVYNIEISLVFICYEIDGDKFKLPLYLLYTDVGLNAESIINYYLNRWTIQTNYKYLKTHLGFNKYKVRSLMTKELVMFIYNQAKNNIPIKKVLNKLKLKVGFLKNP